MTTDRRPRLRHGRPARALIALRLASMRNRLSQQRRRKPGRLIARCLVLGFGGLWFGITIATATYAAARSASSSEDASRILAAFLALVVLGGFVGAAASALQSFYLASDVPFLLTLPIPRHVTFAAKLLDSMAGLIPVTVVLVAAFSGYGLARADRWWFVVAEIAIGLLVLVATAALGVLVIAAIGRFLPPRRTGHVLAVLTMVLVALLWAAYAAVAPDVSAHEPAGEGAANPLALAFAAAGERLDWTPMGWAAAAIVGSGEGAAPMAIAQLGLVIATTIGIVGSAFAVFAASFSRAFGGYRAAVVAVRRPDRPFARWIAGALGLLPTPLAALVAKEWLAMFRDVRRLSGAVWPLGMVAIYTVILSRDQLAAPAETSGLAFWFSCGTLAIVPWGASLGLSIYAFGTEGRQIHLLRSLPVRPHTLLLAKTLANLIPVLLVSEAAALVIGSLHGATFGQLLGLLGLVAWAATGYVLIDTAVSAIAPNFEAEQVQRSTAFVGRIAGFVAGAIFTLASGAAAARLILFATGVPDHLRQAVGWEIVGVQPFGWPMVVGGAAIAALDVALIVALAHSRVVLIVRDG